MQFQKFLIIFLLSIALASFVLLEEEALFDITDYNLVQVLGLALGLLSLIIENFIKTKNHVFALTDKNLFFYCYTYTNNLFLYFFLIWGLFYAHHITPLTNSNIDLNIFLIENISYNTFFKNLNLIFLFYFYSLGLSQLDRLFNYRNVLISVMFTILTPILLVINCTDFLITSKYGYNLKRVNTVSFNIKTSKTYNYEVDNFIFDWHPLNHSAHVISLNDSMTLLGVLLLSLYIIINFIFVVIANCLIVQNCNNKDYIFNFNTASFIILKNFLNIFIFFYFFLFLNCLIYIQTIF